MESWCVGSPLPAASVTPRSPYSVSCCILHSFNNDLKNCRSREKSNVLCKNIEDLHTEENINVCFSDNRYDNCNPTTNRTIPFLTMKIKRNPGIDRYAVVFTWAYELFQKNF